MIEASGASGRMKRNAIIAAVLLVVGIPAAVAAGTQAFTLGRLADATGTDGSVGTFTLVVFAVSVLAVAAGIAFGLTSVVQFVHERSSR